MRSCLVKGDVFHGSISPLKEERGCVCYTLRFDVNSRDREKGGRGEQKREEVHEKNELCSVFQFHQLLSIGANNWQLM